ncbi:MAG TPA: arylsulfotransferase family protein [Thermoanaerobaculia bacterium]
MENSRSRRWPRRVLGAIAIVILIGVSVVYGILVQSRHLFPYSLLKHGFQTAAPRRIAHHLLPGKAVDPPPDSVQKLVHFPYLRGYKSPTEGGGPIRVYDKALAEDGLNFFSSGHAPAAVLMDMDGKILKTWTVDVSKAFAGVVLEDKKPDRDKILRRAHLFPDGGIVAMFEDYGLVRLDPRSNVLWTWRALTHHDFFVAENGEMWAIFHEKRVVPELHREDAVWDDSIAEISPDGKLVKRFSLIECFARSRYAPLLLNTDPRDDDVFHTNSVVVLDGSLADRWSAFRRGNVLVSIKRINTVAVVDAESGQVVWALNGQWYGQHSARLSAKAHLLLFDNLGSMRRASRVLEIDPLTQELLWSYGAREGQSLISEIIGFVERLPRGNTLIAETNYGRVIEVTPDSRIAWEFVNPFRIPKKNEPGKELVAVVYFMERVARSQSFLSSTGGPPPLETPASGSPGR